MLVLVALVVGFELVPYTAQGQPVHRDELQADHAQQRQPQSAVTEKNSIKSCSCVGPGIEDVKYLEPGTIQKW